MSQYRRAYVPGGTYFFTVVTHGRRPFLTDKLARDCLRDAMKSEFAIRPVEVVAVVLLPDHLHTVWTLPQEDDDYSVRWKRIKERFTRAFLAAGGREGQSTLSRNRKRERAVWQRRFWEHTVRDGDDLKTILDYIHWNPVKHGIARAPAEYPWSSFSRWVASGDYPPDWGRDAPADVPVPSGSNRSGIRWADHVGWVKPGFAGADPPEAHKMSARVLTSGLRRRVQRFAATWTLKTDHGRASQGGSLHYTP